MGKNQSEQSLARRNGADVVRGGSAGAQGNPPTTVSVADNTSELSSENNQTGRESFCSEPEVIVTNVKLDIPTIQTPLGYCSRRVDTKLNTEQAERLKSIKFGLQASNAKLKNGVIVRTDGHVLAWILEQI